MEGAGREGNFFHVDITVSQSFWLLEWNLGTDISNFILNPVGEPSVYLAVKLNQSGEYVSLPEEA